MPIPEEQKIKLESMQMKGVKWMIWQNIEKEDIESRLLRIKNQSSTQDVQKLLNSQNRATLLALIEQSPEITPQIIDDAYERYRYGLKPGFTLFWAKNSQKKNIDKNAIETAVKTFLDRRKYDDEAKYKNLEFVAITEFGGTYEISFSYLQKFNYINEAGEFTYVYMMKECFAWVGIEKSFIAINNMPELLMNILKQFFSELYGADITNIKITKDLINKVFPTDKTRRITRHSTNPPENQLEKVTFADQNLSEKMDYIPAGYEDYDITNSQYIETIDENTTGTLGVNCNKGKMYLSKSLTASQFRAWSIRRIDNIISFYQNVTDVTLETISGYNMFSSSVWGSVSKKAIPYLNEIAYALINCKKSNLESYPISFDIYKAYLELSNFFVDKVRLSCDNCEDESIPSCSICGCTHFNITKRLPAKIMCENCGNSQTDSFSFDCENGHTNTINNINEVIELIVKDDFFDRLTATIRLYCTDIFFEKGEFFSLSGGVLSMHRSPDYEKLKPSEIDEFAPIVNRELTHTTDVLNNRLKTLKEKCAKTSNDKCANCKYQEVNSSDEIGCMLKLFETFEEYTPQPHQGHEFGDVSMLVGLHGRNVTFLGAAKAMANPSKVTKSSPIGRELIQQIIDAFNDSRAEVIGVIYPGMIADQLKYLLFNQAKLQNKKLVILDQEFMLKLLDKYLTEKNL